MQECPRCSRTFADISNHKVCPAGVCSSCQVLQKNLSAHRCPWKKFEAFDGGVTADPVHCNRCQQAFYGLRFLKYRIRDSRYCRDCWFRPGFQQDYCSEKKVLEQKVHTYLLEQNRTHCKICECTLLEENGLRTYYEFDHLDVSNKKGNIGKMIMSLEKIEDIKAEINRCRLLCDHCHSLVTQMERDAGVHQLIPLMEQRPELATVVSTRIEAWVQDHRKKALINLGELDEHVLERELLNLDLPEFFEWPSHELTEPVQPLVKRWRQQLGTRRISALGVETDEIPRRLAQLLLFADLVVRLRGYLMAVADACASDPGVRLADKGSQGGTTLVQYYDPCEFLLAAYEYLVKDKGWIQAAQEACRQLLLGLLSEGTVRYVGFGAGMIAWCALSALGLEISAFSSRVENFQGVYMELHNHGEHDGENRLQPENWFSVRG